jgi:hypothetical protein
VRIRWADPGIRPSVASPMSTQKSFGLAQSVPTTAALIAVVNATRVAGALERRIAQYCSAGEAKRGREADV